MSKFTEHQDELKTGGRIWLQSLAPPVFPETLLNLATKTKFSRHAIDSTLNQTLTQGYAFKTHGAGKNKITPDARNYINEIFIRGLTSRPAIAADVEKQMMDEEDENGDPRFDKDSYLDEGWRIDHFLISLIRAKGENITENLFSQ